MFFNKKFQRIEWRPFLTQKLSVKCCYLDNKHHHYGTIVNMTLTIQKQDKKDFWVIIQTKIMMVLLIPASKTMFRNTAVLWSNWKHAIIYLQKLQVNFDKTYWKERISGNMSVVSERKTWTINAALIIAETRKYDIKFPITLNNLSQCR